MDKTEVDKASKPFITNDLLCGVAVILFAISILVQVPGSQGNIMLFPEIVAIVSLISGVMILAVNFMHPSGAKSRDPRPTRIVIVASLFMFAVMLLVNTLGFYVCLFLISMAVNYTIKAFCGEGGSKSLPAVTLMSVGMCALMYVVFGVLLQIITPSGWLI